MRKICGPLVFLLLLFVLAGCDAANSSRQAATISTPTSNSASTSITPTASSSPSLAIPAQPVPTPSPTAKPKPTPGVHVPPSGYSPPITSLATQLEYQLFHLINQDRANQGLYAYVLNSTLSAGARLHSARMSVCGMSHQCPGEPDPCTRVTNEGISWTTCGENVGYTSPTPTAWAGTQGIERYMLAEQPPDDGHRLNLLNSSYHRVGVGIYLDARGYVWITEDFAS